MLTALLADPKMAAFAVTTGVQIAAAASCWYWSRRTLAARMRREAGELRTRAEKAEKALQTVYAGCGPRLWVAFTRGTEFEKNPPKPIAKPAKAKGKPEKHTARNVAAAAAAIVGVLAL